MKKNLQFILDWFAKLSGSQKRNLALVCTVVFSVLLIISVLVSLKREPKEDVMDMPERLNFISPIPADELFFPDEPDYIPGVILERDRREHWTTEEASEYWQDPLKFGEEQWRERIEAAIDEYLERVP